MTKDFSYFWVKFWKSFQRCKLVFYFPEECRDAVKGQTKQKGNHIGPEYYAHYVAAYRRAIYDNAQGNQFVIAQLQRNPSSHMGEFLEKVWEVSKKIEQGTATEIDHIEGTAAMFFVIENIYQTYRELNNFVEKSIAFLNIPADQMKKLPPEIAYRVNMLFDFFCAASPLERNFLYLLCRTNADQYKFLRALLNAPRSISPLEQYRNFYKAIIDVNPGQFGSVKLSTDDDFSKIWKEFIQKVEGLLKSERDPLQILADSRIYSFLFILVHLIFKQGKFNSTFLEDEFEFFFTFKFFITPESQEDILRQARNILS